MNEIKTLNLPALALTVSTNVVQVCKMTTVGFVAYLSAMSNRLTSSHISFFWDGSARPFSFLPKLLKSWLALFCKPRPSSNPAVRSQTVLNQVICMATLTKILNIGRKTANAMVKSSAIAC